MDEEIRVNFLKPMLVLKIRDVYKAPYHKNKFISINRRLVESKKDLINHLQEFTKNWSSGTYELQFLFQERDYAESNIYTTFMRFEVRDGKITKIWKNSPYNKKEYPIWNHFKPELEKPPEKKAKRKTSRKLISRKKHFQRKKTVLKRVSRHKLAKKRRR